MSTTTPDTTAVDAEAMGKALAWVLALVTMLAAGIAASILQGYVLTKLWAWFIAPLGVVQIGTVQAMGITLIVYFLTCSLARRDPKGAAGWQKSLNALLFGVIGTLLTWGFGAIYHAFM